MFAVKVCRCLGRSFEALAPSAAPKWPPMRRLLAEPCAMGLESLHRVKGFRVEGSGIK